MPNLSDLQSTIKELQKMGTFSEEEINWLIDIDKSVSELSEEIGDKLVISYSNSSTNPNPSFSENLLPMKASLSEVLYLLPLQTALVPTGIKLTLPENIGYDIKTVKSNFSKGLIILNGDYSENDEIIIPVLNFNSQPIHITNGDHIGNLVFTYIIPKSAIILKDLHGE